MINDCANEIEKFREDVRHQKVHLDNHFYEFMEFSSQIEPRVQQYKEELDLQIKELLAQAYVVKERLFSGESRDKSNEVAFETLTIDIIENSQNLKKVVPEEGSEDIKIVLNQIIFILEQGQETLDSIQALLSK